MIQTSNTKQYSFLAAAQQHHTVARVFKAVLGLLTYGCLIGEVAALSSDAKQELIIKAPTTSMNLNTGVNTYEDHVIVVQGTSELRADKLVVRTDQNRHIIQATATGKPATYKTLPELGKPEFHAAANTIEFYPDKHQIILLGNAKVNQGQDNMVGPQINYDIEQQIVTTPRSSQGVTTITIQPHQPRAGKP